MPVFQFRHNYHSFGLPASPVLPVLPRSRSFLIYHFARITKVAALPIVPILHILPLVGGKLETAHARHIVKTPLGGGGVVQNIRR